MHLLKPRPKVTVDGIAASGEISPHGTVTHTEHWSGEQDVLAAPATARFKAHPKWADLLRLMELEQAMRDFKDAVTSGHAPDVRRAVARLRDARAAFQTVELGEVTRV